MAFLEPLSPQAAGGAGSSLPRPLLHVSLACTIFATVVSFWSIFLHLKGYRRPNLQRLVVRIMIMIPLYAIASLVSLHSLEAAQWIDAVRDLYEAFVIYTFFSLLIAYLGGERSLLILLHGRPPTRHVFPVSIFIEEMDGSDPYTFLGLKRGILQYVYVKPILALATLILKYTSTYAEGEFGLDTGYTYVSIVYNVSISLSLYCLAMLWVTIHSDVKPFRPTPKFLCVKGILFFSFWQSIAISALVAWKVIKKLGPYTDAEHMSLALNDVMLCLEMPIFAIAHQYAFCRLDDYVDPTLQYVARMPFTLALRDVAGLLDVVSDFKATFLGQGISYRSFEPVEGGVHVLGKARERRIRAGLRYEGGVKGGKKYWLPVPHGDGGVLGGMGRDYGTMGGGGGQQQQGVPTVGVVGRNGHGPHSVGHLSPPVHPTADPLSNYSARPFSYRRIEEDSDDESMISLDFDNVASASGSPGGREGDGGEGNDELLYEEARGFLHGDWGYRVVDVSAEQARRKMLDEEENVLRGYGRSGKGRMRGERWGRGESSAAAVASSTPRSAASEPTRKVYGAWGINDERPVNSIYPTPQHSPPPSQPTFLIDEPDDPSSSSSSSRPSTSRNPTFKTASEIPDLIIPISSASPSSTHNHIPGSVRDWAHKGKATAQHVTHNLLDVASHVVPPTSLQFSPKGSFRGEESEGERERLPEDAVDLLVEAPTEEGHDANGRPLDEPPLVQQYQAPHKTTHHSSPWLDDSSEVSNPWD